MFSHPADFTHACTNEMSGFAERKAEFEMLNIELIGLSNVRTATDNLQRDRQVF